MTTCGVGRDGTRGEDQSLITGSAKYIDDLSLQKEAHIAFVRSPHAHAKIVSIDSSSAKLAPGVIAVFTGADLLADAQRAVNLRLAIVTTYAAFGQAFLEHASDATRMIAMPPPLFNSLDCWWNRWRFGFPLYWTTLAKPIRRHGFQRYRFRRTSPDAFAVHYSTAWWVSDTPGGYLESAREHVAAP